ncbi:MAG: YicC/YloC family endoribonuclease [Gammaproteobacteria bacterium]
MTLSMTGFARAEADTEFGTLSWEARTVNHRHLDLALRLPEECRALEPRVREVVGARIKRGKIDLGLHLRRRDGKAPALALDDGLLAQLIDAAGAVARRLGDSGALNPLDLLRWPGVLRETELDTTPLHAAALELLEAALADLVAGREREGAHIAASIRDKGDEIVALVEGVRARLPAVHARLRDKLLARIAELGATPDPARLEQELVILAQRLDVAEELDRLDAHVSELNAVLGRDEPVGRRLDFLLQEFNREANTLGSKAQDAETTRAAVDLKVLIEQIREQVQNLE